MVYYANDIEAAPRDFTVVARQSGKWAGPDYARNIRDVLKMAYRYEEPRRNSRGSLHRPAF
ncbi:MAG: hypothetical protein LBB81_05950 [Treponema sp.]|nr:hypothetical protein [Treponema sp.]